MTTTAPSFCGSCGTAAAPGSLFCKNCGTAVGAARAAQAVQPLPTVGMVGTPAPAPTNSVGQPDAPPPTVRADSETPVPAGVGARFGALIIDGLIPSLIMSVALFTSLAGSTRSTAIESALIGYLIGVGLTFLWAILLWAMMATKGTSPGKIVVGIKVIREDNGGPPGWGKAFGRLLLRSLLLSVTLLIAGFSPFWDSTKRNQAWWDKAVGTLVIRSNSGSRKAAVQHEPEPETPIGTELSWDAAPPKRAPKAAVPEASWSDRPVSTAPVARGTSIPPSPPSLLPPVTGTQPIAAQPIPTQQMAPQPTTAAPVPWSQPTGTPGVITSVPGRAPRQPEWPPTSPPPQGEPQSYGAPTRLQPLYPPAPPPAPPAHSALAATYPPLAAVGETHEHTQLSARSRMAAATPTRVGPSLTALLDTGVVVELQDAVLIGRDPAAADGEDGVALLKLPDTTRSVSKTHLLIETTAGGTFVTDRHSTNGVAIRFSSGDEQKCPPGERTAVPRGATITFGDRHLTLRQV